MTAPDIAPQKDRWLRAIGYGLLAEIATIITIVAVIFFAVYLWGIDQLIVQLGHFGGWLLSLVGLA